MKELAGYLKNLRGDLSIRQVAEKTGISNAYLSQLESQKRKKPHPEVLQKLADFYDVPILELFEKAGYLEKGEIEKTQEQDIENKFAHVISDPQFKHGTKVRGEYDLNAKRFIIEMYEKATNRKLL